MLGSPDIHLPEGNDTMASTRTSRTKASRTTPIVVASLATLSLFSIAACGGSETSENTQPASTDLPSDTSMVAPVATDPCETASGSLTVYSGRSEKLVADLYTQFTSDTGIDVEVRYGDSGELAGQILTEGNATPADVFFSQDAGALGAVSEAGLFLELEDSVLNRVAAKYSSESKTWVGTSGRARVVIFNPTLVSTPPTSIDELVDPQWNGKIAFAPTNASWQSFVTALRVVRGEDDAREWLEAFAANNPVAYEKNGAVRDAVNSGEVALGLVNHYYLYEKIAAEGAENVVAQNQYLPGDIGGLVNVAGIGALENSDNPTGSQCLASYLVSDTAQKFFVEKSFEYPLVDGIAPFDGLPTLAELDPPSIDLSDLKSIAETQELLNDIGLLSL
jgi:iron(III) transport system substrate-binding protein